MEHFIVKLDAKLSEIVLRNTAEYVSGKIRAAKRNKDEEA